MPDLKSAIVVVNEFTYVPSGTNQSTRGATPGDYVMRYMARSRATEVVAPIRRWDTDIEGFTTRYMAREEATERAGSVHEAKHNMRHAQGLGGVAFGYGQASLSDGALRAASHDLQRLFDKGHTVMKTVLSFEPDYLVERGLVEPEFELVDRGDYRGNLDQMKLRMAVMHGLERMSHEYDDLRYVGVIQVDTAHVHCHLAMADAGPGRLAVDGSQKGKISSRSKMLLRRGVDAWLDEKQTVKFLSSAVGYDRRNVTMFVKKWAHNQMLRESLPQFLVSCLPADRRLWRADTNRKEMRKPNAIARELVLELLNGPGSPMGGAMADVEAYANQRREAEGLSTGQWRTLIDNGREQIIAACVNGVYGMLRTLPEDTLRVRTPMLDLMSMDYQDVARLAAQQQEPPEPMIDFGFKLRSYATRLNHHRERRGFYHEQVRSWEAADKAGVADPASRALYDFYLNEEQYHAGCTAKYVHFLPFSVASQQWYDDWGAVAEYGERMLSLEMMTKDDGLRKFKDPEQAEARGLSIYGQRGGRLMTEGAPGRQILTERAQRMRLTYHDKLEDLKVALASKGLALVAHEIPQPAEVPAPPELGPAPKLSPTASITMGPEFDFEDVKGLDLHHMRFDFVTDVPVGSRAHDAFVTAARRRASLLEGAVDYLDRSGQGLAIDALPTHDIKVMVTLADQLESAPQAVLPSHVATLLREQGERGARRSRTVQLSLDLAEQLDETVSTEVVHSVSEIVGVPVHGHGGPRGPFNHGPSLG